MAQRYHFVEVVVNADDRGTMDTRHLRDICDDAHMQPVEDWGRPPFHPNCRCETAFRLEEIENVDRV